MTLLELMVVGAIGATVAAATTVNVVEQVRRVKATDAARGVLAPHTISRDRAVAARTCTETLMVPPIGQPFTPPAENEPTKFPVDAQRTIPRVAVIEWSACDGTATISRVDFFDLDGDISLAPYNSTDGRAVFGPSGGLTDDRPGAFSGLIAPGAKLPGCQPPPPPILLKDPAEGEGEGEGEATKGTGQCSPPPPPAQQGPPADILFSATTYFGENESYRIYARVGATEHLE